MGTVSFPMDALGRKLCQSPSLWMPAMRGMYLESYGVYLFAEMPQEASERSLRRNPGRWILRGVSGKTMRLVSYLRPCPMDASLGFFGPDRTNSQLESGEDLCLVECIYQANQTADFVYLEKRSV